MGLRPQPLFPFWPMSALSTSCPTYGEVPGNRVTKSSPVYLITSTWPGAIPRGIGESHGVATGDSVDAPIMAAPLYQG
jgi:hypothetical protein